MRFVCSFFPLVPPADTMADSCARMACAYTSTHVQVTTCTHKHTHTQCRGSRTTHIDDLCCELLELCCVGRVASIQQVIAFHATDVVGQRSLAIGGQQGDHSDVHLRLSCRPRRPREALHCILQALAATTTTLVNIHSPQPTATAQHHRQHHSQSTQHTLAR